MTEQEFISHWVGTPWLERGNSKDGIDADIETETI